MRFIIRTIAAGAISVIARIIIKKIQDTNAPDKAGSATSRANARAARPS